jgi:hypothetical protein
LCSPASEILDEVFPHRDLHYNWRGGADPVFQADPIS